MHLQIWVNQNGPLDNVREREKEREAGFRQKFYQLKQSNIAWNMYMFISG